MSNAALQNIIARIQAVSGSWTRETSLNEMRASWAALYTGENVPAGTEDVTAGAVPCRWFSAPGSNSHGMFLYFHGGAFQMGSPDTHAALVARISAASGLRGLSVDYRLAPEHRFPAPLEDARTVYAWLLDQGYEPQDIVLCGDSAGGGLCLSLMLSLREEGQPLPTGAALMSPWTDMTISGESYDTRKNVDPLHQRGMLEAVARTYLGKTGDPKNPLASPLLADPADLPPLLIQVGDDEVVLDDSVVFAEACRSAGVDVTLEVEKNMIHVFQLYANELPEARAAIDRIGRFLRDRVTHSGSV